MSIEKPRLILLKDYAPTPYQINHVDLQVVLHPTRTTAVSEMAIAPRAGAAGPLILDGEDIELLSIAIDGVDLEASQYSLADNRLIVPTLPHQAFKLRIEQRSNPTANTALSGLYLSNGFYCTQMEAEGFRRFAFYYDRPDVMATFTVRVEAPLHLPVLLSNGNLVSKGKTDKGNHFAIWHDPHPKPAYLFALVAGDLAMVQDTFTTSDGREVELGIYVEKGKENRCAWAMESLKTCMRWDEESFDRIYDLNVFNIVAVSNFNMGAMENKGLNIFNDKYILALPETATDQDYINIEAIIAHEYFHNWTGNRITCRDWFQLCLKEGLTVFRDQEFTSSIRSRAVKRIQDVKTLRARQFPEDQGPLAHPVRPSSYIEINNFYTPTIYEKGAEICRMIKTIIGAEAFRNGMDYYFEKFDGTAATVEDFISSFQNCTDQDLSQIFLWYQQAGTPIVTMRSQFENGLLRISLTQQTPPTPGQESKLPLAIPLTFGLVGEDGKDIATDISVLLLTQMEQTFTFESLPKKPVISINRGFSAPCILKSDLSHDDHIFLIGHDSDAFNRWESAQTIARGLIISSISALEKNNSLPDVYKFSAALKRSLEDERLDPAFKSLMLSLPGEAEIAAILGHDVDSDLVFKARELMRAEIAEHLHETLLAIFHSCSETGDYRPDPQGTARRSLRGACLALLAASNGPLALELAKQDLANPTNMTIEMNALTGVLALPGADELLQQFLDRHHSDHLLVDKWLMMNAQVTLPGAAQRVEKLLHHPLFTLKTPNKVYALIGGFTANQVGFHAADGEGYRLLADVVVALNKTNPQVAARISNGFRSWRIFDTPRKALANREMKRILAEPNLSPDVFEIITRTLGND